MRFFRDRSGSGDASKKAAAPPPSNAPEPPAEAEESKVAEALPAALRAARANAARSRGAPVLEDPPYKDPFAARARLRSMPARGPVRRRIWDLEEESAEADGESASHRTAQDAEGILEGLDDAPFSAEEVFADVIPNQATHRVVSRTMRSAAGAPEPRDGDTAQGDAELEGPAPQAPRSADAAPSVTEARAQLARIVGAATIASADPAPSTGPTASGSTPPAGHTAAPGPSSRRAKTRLLGFQARELAARDPFAQDGAAPSDSAAGPHFPVGWIVVADGPGRGASFTLQAGVSSIGRGGDQTVRLDFGDTSISRQNHASIAYDDEAQRFFLGHGGKSNIVRLNGRPVLSTEDLGHCDTIRIGETTLRFVALCGDGFTWSNDDDEARTPEQGTDDDAGQ